MTTRAYSTTATNAENKPAVSGKDVVLPRRFEVTKRPALHSIANRTVEPSISNVNTKKVVTRPMTRSSVAQPMVKPVKVLDVVKPVKAVVVAKAVSGNVIKPAVLSHAAVSAITSSSEAKSESPVPMDISKVDELTEAFSNQVLDVEDVDEGDDANPQLASIYVNDIYNYLRQLEVTYAVRPKHLEGQIVTGRMRGILIDWLSQVSRRFEMLTETFYLTVNILDRYMQECSVAKNKLQLVGVTALFLAAKYEEIYVPPIDELAYITDRAYTTSEIRRMEVIMLKQLDFSFGSPLPIQFLRRVSKAGRVNITEHTLAKYFCELAVVEYDIIHSRPSLIAAAALYLALTLLRKSHNWSNTLVHYSNYTEKEVKPLSCKMAAVVIKQEKSKLQAICHKYASRKLMEISTIEELKGERIKALAELASTYTATV